MWKISKCRTNVSKSKSTNKTTLKFSRARLRQNRAHAVPQSKQTISVFYSAHENVNKQSLKTVIEKFDVVSKKCVRKWFCWNVAIFWWEVGRRPVFSSVDISASGESQSQRREHKSLLTKTEPSLQDKFQEFTSEDKIHEEEWSKITWSQLKWSEI